MDPALAVEVLERRALTGRLPAAVITVVLYGQCVDANATAKVCVAYDVLVIDADEELGAPYKDRQRARWDASGV